ncbi:MAG: hypothetical protein MZV64_24005 [Ignavibacteriales bacterium]|nr:hypothetical protein [Ignavibacteriales bacterium]
MEGKFGIRRGDRFRLLHSARCRCRSRRGGWRRPPDGIDHPRSGGLYCNGCHLDPGEKAREVTRFEVHVDAPRASNIQRCSPARSSSMSSQAGTLTRHPSLRAIETFSDQVLPGASHGLARSSRWNFIMKFTKTRGWSEKFSPSRHLAGTACVTNR